MGTLAISISAPPSGELETSRNGSSPTAAQMDEELQVRQKFLKIVAPYLTSLPERSAQRLGNVSHVELLGHTVWSQLNHYLLLVTVDIGDPGIDQQLSTLLPQGSQVSVTGYFGGIEDWPAIPASEPSRMLLTSPANGQVMPAAELVAAKPAGAQAAAAATSLRARLGSVRTWALSTAERAFFTFAASFGSAVALGGAFNISTLDATLFAAASAALAVVTAAIRSLSPPTDNATLDVVTRAGLTLLQAFAAAFVITTAGATHFSDWRAGALAGLAAAFTALKGTLATQLNGANATNGQRATPGSLIPLHLGPARKTSLPAGGLQVSAGQ
jgi:hypothetical protein